MSVEVLGFGATHDGLLGAVVGAFGLVVVAIISARKSTGSQVDEFRTEVRERLNDIDRRMDRLDERLNHGRSEPQPPEPGTDTTPPG